MPVATEPTAQIASYRKVLAEATKECPCQGCNRTPKEQHQVDCGCKGTGLVARFPGFRQVCQVCAGYEGQGHDCPQDGWQVRAGGLEDALAGLIGLEFWRWRDRWTFAIGVPAMADKASMPSGDTILAEGLRLVIEIAGLEVPDAV